MLNQKTSESERRRERSRAASTKKSRKRKTKRKTMRRDAMGNGSKKVRLGIVKTSKISLHRRESSGIWQVVSALANLRS